MLQLLMILLGAIVLLLCVLISKHLQKRIACPWFGPRSRVHFPRKVLKLLRQSARADFVQDVLMLMELLLRVRRNVRRMPPLPADQHSHPRLMELAHALAERTDFSPEDMVQAVRAINPVTSEVLALPDCVCVLLVERLRDDLTALKRGASNRLPLANDMRQTVQRLRELLLLDWAKSAEQADPIHAELMADPMYARMDTLSRQGVRTRLEQICQRTHTDAPVLLEAARQLVTEAEPGSLEAALPYWLLNSRGMQGLIYALRTRRGLLRLWFLANPAKTERLMRTAWLTACGAVFLQMDQPVFMLPLFLPVVGCAGRFLLPRLRADVPYLADVPEDVRTLAVLPVQLRDAHQAISAVRRMKVLRSTFPKNIDLMMIADFDGHMSPLSASAQAIMQAAASAVMALGGFGARVMYIQRAQNRGDAQGAVSSVCRLVTQGTCEDVFACTTVDLTALYRRYAFVLSVPEDERPAPGLAEKLLAALCHPLNAHYPVPDGFRGHGCARPQTGQIRLLDPQAFLEHTDGLVVPGMTDQTLTDHLCGCVTIPDGTCIRPAALPLSEEFDHDREHALQAWRNVMWLLPFVQTPSGLVRNPLRSHAKAALRQSLRVSLLPMCSLMLAFWGCLSGDWLLSALAFLLPEWRMLRRPSRVKALHTLACWSLMPTRGLVSLIGLYDAYVPHDTPTDWPQLELWAQGVAATLFAAIGIAIPSIPALMASALFAAFPLAHRVHDQPLHAAEPLTQEQHAFLTDLLRRCHSYFKARHDALPPDMLQAAPDVGPSAITTPPACAGMLLAVVCAKDAGLLHAQDASAQLERLIDALSAQSRPWGLPCSRYDPVHGVALDASVDTADTAILIASLLTAAQALRTWLPELPEDAADVSAKFTAYVDSLDMMQLYHQEQQLFHAGLDANGQPCGLITAFADEALLLSIVAGSRGLISPEHFRRLLRTRIRVRGREVLLSRTGTAAQHLLTNLFVPDLPGAEAFFRLMADRAIDGLFGQDACLAGPMDADLRANRASFGMPEAALQPGQSAPVFTPYAAALGLTVNAAKAADGLMAFANHGALGEFGLLDAVDASTGSVSGAYSAWHTGAVMAAAAHVLADAPVRRYFCAIPEIEAVLPLVTEVDDAPVLRALPVTVPDQSASLLSPRICRATIPMDAHLLGSSACGLAVASNGNAALTLHSMDAARTIRIYVGDGGRAYPLDASEADFAPGCVRIRQSCGSLLAELTVTLDPVHHQSLHALTVTNLSTHDREIEAASLVVPTGFPGMAEVFRASADHLAAYDRVNGRVLHHRVRADGAICAVTDLSAFVGHGHTLEHPALLAETADDLVKAAIQACMAFRVRLAVRGREQVTAVFSVSAEEHEVPDLSAIGGFVRLCALQAEGIAAQIPLTAEQTLAASLLTGAVLSAPRSTGIPDIDAWFRLHGVVPDEDKSPLLNGDAPLIPQIEALYAAHSDAAAPVIPQPGELAETPQLHLTDPDAGDLLITLQRGQTTPERWINRHTGPGIAETVDESGLDEDILITLADGTSLSPWTAELPRTVRFSAGMTTWKCFAKDASVTLHAFAMPDKPLLMRILRVKSAAPVRILVNSQLQDAQDEAVWSRSASGEMTFLQDAQASSMLRYVRACWANRLDALTIDTPEESLNQLMNRVLPVQVMTADAPSAAAALSLMHPVRALRRLLRWAQRAISVDDWAEFAVMAAIWCAFNGHCVVDVHLPGQTESLWECCRASLLSLSMDDEHLPTGEHRAEKCFMFALAAGLLTGIRPDQALEELRRRLLNAADAHLWQGGFYGDEAVTLMAQALAVAAYNSDQRSRQALRTALDALQNTESALIRHAPVSEKAALPGLPENGGLRMPDTVAAIGALIQADMPDEAARLIETVNPVIRTRDALGMETFRITPNRLPGGICMSPTEEGRAMNEGDHAAGWLMHIVLTQLLGVRRRGSVFRVAPHVPQAWQEFGVTIRMGQSTWRIHCSRRCAAFTIDGLAASGDEFTVHDDGRIHLVQLPL